MRELSCQKNTQTPWNVVVYIKVYLKRDKNICFADDSAMSDLLHKNNFYNRMKE